MADTATDYKTCCPFTSFESDVTFKGGAELNRIHGNEM